MRNFQTGVFAKFSSLGYGILFLAGNLSALTSYAQTEATWVPCATEGQSCSIPGGQAASVRFGAKGNYSTEYNIIGSINCNNQTFGGDPALGVSKSCDYTFDLVRERAGQLHREPVQVYLIVGQSKSFSNGIVYRQPLNINGSLSAIDNRRVPLGTAKGTFRDSGFTDTIYDSHLSNTIFNHVAF